MGLPTFTISPTKRNRNDASGHFLVSEGKRIKFKICRDDISKKIRIKLGINNATAESGKNKDYLVQRTTKSFLKFKKGQECKTISIKALKDNEIETDEYLSLYVKSNPKKYNLSDTSGSIRIRIIDDGMYGGGTGSGGDSKPQGNSESSGRNNTGKFYVKQPYNVYEGEEASFTILRTKTGKAGSVSFTLSGRGEELRHLDPADSGTDYGAPYLKDRNGEKIFIRDNVNFIKGEIEKTVFIQTKEVEDCASHALFMSVNDGSSSKHLEIKDTTEAKNNFSISSPGNVKEGDVAKISIKRTDSCGKNGYREVYLNIDSGTADSSDYNIGSDSYRKKVVFQPGEIEQTVEIPINKDCLNEGDEYFYYSIEGASQQDQTPRNEQDIPSQYKKIIEDNANSDCPPTAIKCEREWSDHHDTFIDTCSGEFKESFKVSGSATRTETRDKVENNQRMDRYNISDTSNNSGTWKEFLPKLTTNAGSGELVKFLVGFKDIYDVMWSYTFFDDAYVESRRRCLNKNKWHSDPLISFQEAKTMIEDEHGGTRSFINGEYAGADEGKDDKKFSLYGNSSRTLTVYHGSTTAALPATEDYWHSGTNDYECTEGVYPDNRNYTLELIPV